MSCNPVTRVRVAAIRVVPHSRCSQFPPVHRFNPGANVLFAGREQQFRASPIFDIFKREASRFSNPVFRNSGGWSRDQRVFYNFRGSSGIRERAPHTCPGSLASCDHTYEARRISITDPGTHLLIDEPLLPESPTPRRHSSEAIFTILINVNLLFFSSRFPFSRFHLRPVPATTSARCQRQSSAQKPA